MDSSFLLYERKPPIGASVQFTRRAQKHNFRTITVDEAKHTERASCIAWRDKQTFYSNEEEKGKKTECFEPNEECLTVDENASNGLNLRKTDRAREPDWKL